MSEAIAKDEGWRADVYRRANGTDRLTPRQRRRLGHKRNRAAKASA